MESVFTLRCTQKLLKRLRAKPALAPSPSMTVLGDWYANYLTVRRRHLVLCCCDRTFLPIVLEARDLASLVPRLRASLVEVLRLLVVPEPQIDDELAIMNEAVIAKTASRSVLGIMNDYALAIEYRDEAASLHDFSLFLSHTPLFASTPQAVWPDAATRVAFEEAARSLAQ